MERLPKSRSSKKSKRRRIHSFEREEMLAELKHSFPHLSQPLVLDAHYYVPSEKDLLVFAGELLEWLDYFDLTDAEGKFLFDEDYDCEDIAGLAHALLKIKHLRAKLHGLDVSRGAPAVMLAFYDRKVPGGFHGHCALFIRKAIDWKFFEPQTQALRALTDDERTLTWGGLI